MAAPKILAVSPLRMDVVVPVLQIGALQRAVANRTAALRNVRTIALGELNAEETDIATLRLAMLAIAQQADGALKS